MATLKATTPDEQMAAMDVQGNRLYCYRRKTSDGQSFLLAGLEHLAPDADAAMRFLKLTMGYTAKQGWYADDVTDNKEFRAWAERFRRATENV